MAIKEILTKIPLKELIKHPIDYFYMYRNVRVFEKREEKLWKKANPLVFKKFCENGVESLTDDEVIGAFGYCVRVASKEEKVYSVEEYNKLHHRYFQLEENSRYSKKDKLRFPSYGHMNSSYEELSFLKELGDALNSLEGVTASDGTIYEDKTTNYARIVWRITFDSIEVLSHFRWACCFRYIPFHNWALSADISDPNYNCDKIEMELGYMNLDANREEWEKAVKDFTEGVKNYAQSQYNQVGKTMQELKNNK